MIRLIPVLSPADGNFSNRFQAELFHAFSQFYRGGDHGQVHQAFPEGLDGLGGGVVGYPDTNSWKTAAEGAQHWQQQTTQGHLAGADGDSALVHLGLGNQLFFRGL